MVIDLHPPSGNTVHQQSKAVTIHGDHSVAVVEPGVVEVVLGRPGAGGEAVEEGLGGGRARGDRVATAAEYEHLGVSLDIVLCVSS